MANQDRTKRIAATEHCAALQTGKRGAARLAEVHPGPGNFPPPPSEFASQARDFSRDSGDLLKERRGNRKP